MRWLEINHTMLLKILCYLPFNSVGYLVWCLQIVAQRLALLNTLSYLIYFFHNIYWSHIYYVDFTRDLLTIVGQIFLPIESNIMMLICVWTVNRNYIVFYSPYSFCIVRDISFVLALLLLSNAKQFLNASLFYYGVEIWRGILHLSLCASVLLLHVLWVLAAV